MIEWTIDKFPPLNLFNYPSFYNMISEIDIKDYKDAGFQQPGKPGQYIAVTPLQMQEFLKYKPTQKQMSQALGIKYDQGKPRMDLLDATALEGLAKVLTFGANKYTQNGVSGANNWRAGIQYSRLISSLLRHLSAIQRGELIDPESGLPHIDHLGCNWMFLSNFMKQEKQDNNDLYAYRKT